MARKKSKRAQGDEVKLEMTPMIDVVFQLLIFFIVTIKQEDILASVLAMRPEPSITQTPPPPDHEPTTIIVDSLGFTLRNRRVTEAELSRSLERIASYDTKRTIVIKCTADSLHQHLMKVLDVCARHKLESIAIFSM